MVEMETCEGTRSESGWQGEGLHGSRLQMLTARPPDPTAITEIRLRRGTAAPATLPRSVREPLQHGWRLRCRRGRGGARQLPQCCPEEGLMGCRRRRLTVDGVAHPGGSIGEVICKTLRRRV